MPRPTMVDLVADLRSRTGAEPDDLFQGVTYWTGDQLEAELDRYKYLIYGARLSPVARVVNGTTVYLEYTFTLPRGFWIEPITKVRLSTGYEVAEPFTVEHNEQAGAGIVTFSANYGNRQLTADLTVFDWHMAAASVWEQKAAHRYDYIRIKAADHQFAADAEYNHCVERCFYHRSKRVKNFPATKGIYTPDTTVRRR